MDHLQVRNTETVSELEGRLTFGNIAFTHSRDVHVGNRTIYNAPVTINYVGRRESVNLNPRNVIRKYNLIVKWLQVIKTKQCLLAITASSVSILALTGLLAMFLTNSSEHIQQVVPPHPQENDSGKLIIIQRNEWHARPTNKKAIMKLLHPVDCIIISHTFSRDCNTFDECAAVTRSLQDSHVNLRAWPDIGYNFLVGGDGYIYVGRGWDVQPSHGYEEKNGHISINFIGKFATSPAAERQIVAAQQLIEEGVHLKKVSERYDLLGLCQIIKSKSPGEFLYEQIKTWPHWKNVSHCSVLNTK